MGTVKGNNKKRVGKMVERHRNASAEAKQD